MKIIKAKDYQDMSRKAANVISAQMTMKPNQHKRYIANRYRKFFMSISVLADNRDCKMIYEGLVSGDPKLRTYRALYQRIYGKYITEAKKKEESRHGQ